jgi:hypothetical protein
MVMSEVTLHVGQYIARRRDGHLLDDSIAVATWIYNPFTPPHSHSEFRFSDRMCFSSTNRKDKDGNRSYGTRFLRAEQVFHNKDRWDLYEKNFTVEEEAVMRARAESINGRPYYFVGIFADFFLPFGWFSAWYGKKKNQWYCSQAVFYVITGKRKRISPRRLTKWMLKNGWKKAA